MNYYPWIISLRLKTLSLSLSAILVGNALAFWQRNFSFTIFFLTAITAVLLQILSNLANDYGDVIKGSDSLDRIGPSRGLQLGLITLGQLRIALWINVFLCTVFGSALLAFSCDNLFELVIFLLLGLLSIVAAVTYTVGKKPYGYMGFGDLSVLIFFGLISVMGSYYLQTKSLPLFLLFPAIGCGLLSVAVLNVNNLRDRKSDLINRKRTLVVLIGHQMGCYYHLTLLLLSLGLLSYFSCQYLHSTSSWLFLVMLPFYGIHIFDIFRFKVAADIALLLLQMVKLALFTNLLYCLGIIFS